MSDEFASKTELRIAALARRDRVPVEHRDAAAQIIASHTLPVEFSQNGIVSGYSPINSEIDPLPLLTVLAARGLRLALPVVTGGEAPLMFREWTIDALLKRGPLGIFQPTSEADEVEPDVVIVPLAAFDRVGHRIGYGAGYYDRTLAALRTHRRIAVIGLAHSVQEVDRVPAEPHDVPLDCVLTEREVIDCRG